MTIISVDFFEKKINFCISYEPGCDISILKQNFNKLINF